MSSDLYCPICFGKLDKTGSCWVTCEYEAKFATPEMAPISRVKSLEGLISKVDKKINDASVEIEVLTGIIAAYRKELMNLKV